MVSAIVVISDTYSEALSKRKSAETRSDLSAESATEDRQTRHERCQVAGEEYAECSAKRSAKVKIPPAAVSAQPEPTVPAPPAGLQISSLSSQSKCSLFTNCCAVIRHHAV